MVAPERGVTCSAGMGRAGIERKVGGPQRYVHWPTEAAKGPTRPRYVRGPERAKSGKKNARRQQTASKGGENETE